MENAWVMQIQRWLALCGCHNGVGYVEAREEGADSRGREGV